MGGPFRDIRVLDLTTIWSGPYGGKLLAAWGADVIKIQNRPSAEQMAQAGRNAYSLVLDGGKKGVCLDLATPRGKDVFLRLVAVSDVVIDNYSARVMPNLGLTYDVLAHYKSDIIVVSMPAFGTTGPEKDFVGYGSNIEQLAGMTALTGYYHGPPIRSGTNYGDPIAGAYMASAVFAALIYRRRTGKGQFIDISQREGLIGYIGEAVMDFSMNRRVQERMGNRHPYQAPHGVYRCLGEDDWIAIAVETDQQWQHLQEVLGNPAWAREEEKFGDSLARYNHQRELDASLGQWTQTQHAFDLAARLQEAGVPAQVVFKSSMRVNQQAVVDPQLRERGFFFRVKHPLVGEHLYPRLPWIFSRTPHEIPTPSPLPGEHNTEVLTRVLGIGPEELAELEAQDVIWHYPVPSG